MRMMQIHVDMRLRMKMMVGLVKEDWKMSLEKVYMNVNDVSDEMKRGNENEEKN